MLRRMLPQIKPIIKNIENKVYPESDFVMNFDGCSKGNPGLSGAGAVIYCLNDEIWSGSLFVGKNATNNQSEYTGLIFGLQQAIDMNIKTLLVKGDSQLVINQMTGRYKCNSENIIELYERAKDLEKNFEKIYYLHVLRNINKRADQLSNEAIKDYINVSDNIISDYIK
jgi:ribonuclease HI